MIIGDWEFYDIVSYIYFSLFSMWTLAALFIIIWILVQFWREMKESYIDLLRITQFIFILIWYFYSVFYIICSFWYRSTYGIVFKIIIAIFESWELYYFIVYLTTWYLLLIQILIMHQLRINSQYQECK